MAGRSAAAALRHRRSHAANPDGGAGGRGEGARRRRGRDGAAPAAIGAGGDAAGHGERRGPVWVRLLPGAEPVGAAGEPAAGGRIPDPPRDGAGAGAGSAARIGAGPGGGGAGGGPARTGGGDGGGRRRFGRATGAGDPGAGSHAPGGLPILESEHRRGLGALGAGGVRRRVRDAGEPRHPAGEPDRAVRRDPAAARGAGEPA